MSEEVCQHKAQAIGTTSSANKKYRAGKLKNMANQYFVAFLLKSLFLSPHLQSRKKEKKKSIKSRFLVYIISSVQLILVERTRKSKPEE